MKINRSLLARLREAIPLAKTLGSVRRLDPDAIAKTIHQALASAGLQAKGPESREAPTPNWRTPDAAPEPGTAPPDSSGPSLDDALAWARGRSRNPGRREPIDLEHAGVRTGPGEFLTRSFSNDAGTRSYKLYVPSSYSSASDAPVALVVMLHGCTQSPDDFAAGTRMNALAERHGFLVVYPAQTPNANGSKCWNWFRAEDQARDRGEPALIAGITREIAARYRVDGRRIFVAGLSAGGAMAVVLAATYPELYAAAGVHSGLPYAVARDVASAFAAMNAGRGGPSRMSPGPGAEARLGSAIPTIIFHGDNDTTVSASNADAIFQQARASRPGGTALQSTVFRGTSANGRDYTRTVLVDGAQQPVIERWVLHGAGHGWSGGSHHGSFTDPSGPDASAEMIRFFFSQPRGGSA